jgi:uncharacterized BrkB/YihY/UPF0761 family membrane protein
MYAWIWRHLPGNRLVRMTICAALIAAIVWALFTHVFPWLDPRLPFNKVTGPH